MERGVSQTKQRGKIFPGCLLFPGGLQSQRGWLLVTGQNPEPGYGPRPLPYDINQSRQFPRGRKTAIGLECQGIFPNSSEPLGTSQSSCQDPGEAGCFRVQ